MITYVKVDSLVGIRPVAVRTSVETDKTEYCFGRNLWRQSVRRARADYERSQEPPETNAEPAREAKRPRSSQLPGELFACRQCQVIECFTGTMTTEDVAVLDGFLRDLGTVQVNKSALGEAKKKPLLLLLVLAMIKRGALTENRIRFTDIEKRLSELITRYGGRSTESGPKPEQPFYHLRTSPFWQLTVPGGLPPGNKKTVAKQVLAASGAFAQLPTRIFEVLRQNPGACDQAADTILRRWWDHAPAMALRSELGLNSTEHPL